MRPKVLIFLVITLFLQANLYCLNLQDLKDMDLDIIIEQRLDDETIKTNKIVYNKSIFKIEIWADKNLDNVYCVSYYEYDKIIKYLIKKLDR